MYYNIFLLICILSLHMKSKINVNFIKIRKRTYYINYFSNTKINNII